MDQVGYVNVVVNLKSGFKEFWLVTEVVYDVCGNVLGHYETLISKVPLE